MQKGAAVNKQYCNTIYCNIQLLFIAFVFTNNTAEIVNWIKSAFTFLHLADTYLKHIQNKECNNIS